MTTKLKLSILVSGILIVAALAATAYWRGRRVGKATTNLAHVTKEISLLEDDKLAIRKEVHALDTDALRTRILELSSRNHEVAVRAR